MWNREKEKGSIDKMNILSPVIIVALVLLVISAILSLVEMTVISAVLLIACLLLKKNREYYASYQDEKARELHDKLMSVFPESRYVKVSGSNQSFTIDKKHIYLCLKDKDGAYYDDNSLMHVLLHEYAHVLCDEFDTDPHKEHGDKFKGIFHDLILKAQNAGIYNPSIPMIDNYCGY